MIAPGTTMKYCAWLSMTRLTTRWVRVRVGVRVRVRARARVRVGVS